MGVPYAEVIGDPVAHSKSPLIHHFWLRKLDLEGSFKATRVKAGALGPHLEARRHDPDWRGCSVTIPHKEAIAPRLDSLDDGDVGAVNCVTLEGTCLVGRNTDRLGLEEALSNEATGKVCLIGTGGAARSAMAFLQARGSEVRILARDSDKARHLLREFDASGSVYPLDRAGTAIEGASGVINATSLGMSGQPDMPIAVLEALARSQKGAFVLDMVYSPLRTRLLERADAVGARTIDGLHMLIGQAAHAFELFFGAGAPRRHDAELRELLTR